MTKTSYVRETIPLPVRAQNPTRSPSRKPAPTLGFNRVKDVSPVGDVDAFLEEGEMQKKLPGNEFVKDKRALHEGALMHEFLEGFKDSKECNGITFYMSDKKVPDFGVQITVNFHDQPNHEQVWIWTLFDKQTKKLGVWAPSPPPR